MIDMAADRGYTLISVADLGKLIEQCGFKVKVENKSEKLLGIMKTELEEYMKNKEQFLQVLYNVFLGLFLPIGL